VRRLVMAVAFGWLMFSPAMAAKLAERLETCLACHGAKGTSETPDTPSLGGQSASYLLTQIFTFREKLRKSEPMNELTNDLTDDDLRAASEILAKLPAPQPSKAMSDPARIARAEPLLSKARCNGCHQANLTGDGQVPRIAAQREDYLLKSLRAYKAGERVGYDPAMIEVMRALTDENIVDLAHYLSRVP
jgi:cytochrome c553